MTKVSPARKVGLWCRQQQHGGEESITHAVLGHSRWRAAALFPRRRWFLSPSGLPGIMSSDFVFYLTGIKLHSSGIIRLKSFYCCETLTWKLCLWFNKRRVVMIKIDQPSWSILAGVYLCAPQIAAICFLPPILWASSAGSRWGKGLEWKHCSHSDAHCKGDAEQSVGLENTQLTAVIHWLITDSSRLWQ